MPPFAVTAQVAFRGPRSIRRCRCANSRSAAWFVRSTVVFPSVGERQHRRELLARQDTPDRPGGHDHRRRDDAARGLRRSLQIGRRHARWIVFHRQRDRVAREALERVDDHLRRSLLRQRVADRPGHDRDAEALAHESRFAVRRPDLFRDEGELVIERGVVDARRRCPVAPEEPEREPAVAPERRETPAPARRCRDRRVPIHAHSERARRDRDVLRPDDERHRDALQARGPTGQELLSRGRGQSADIDAGDPRPAGEPAGRAREERGRFPPGRPATGRNRRARSTDERAQPRADVGPTTRQPRRTQW